MVDLLCSVPILDVGRKKYLKLEGTYEKALKNSVRYRTQNSSMPMPRMERNLISIIVNLEIKIPIRRGKLHTTGTVYDQIIH